MQRNIKVTGASHPNTVAQIVNHEPATARSLGVITTQEVEAR